MQNTEGRGLCPPAEQIPKPIAPVIGKASATNPLQHPALPVPMGWGRVWPPNWPSMEESRIPAMTEDPKAQCKQLPSHRTQPGPHCFHVIVVLGGWGKTIFQGPKAGRRKERLLCFQACVMGKAASAGVLPSWSLQLPHSTGTETTDPTSPNWVSLRGQMCSGDAPRAPFFPMCHTGNCCLEK